MKEDTSKPEEDETNGERQNAQHLPQDSSLVESERIERVTTEEENGRGGNSLGRNEREDEKARRGKKLSNLVGCRFPPFCRACLSLFRRESEKIDCSGDEGGGVVGTRRRRTGVSKRKRKHRRGIESVRQTRVSAKYLDEIGGRSFKREEEREKERARETKA